MKYKNPHLSIYPFQCVRRPAIAGVLQKNTKKLRTLSNFFSFSQMPGTLL
jgi:hypothetical protein